MAKDETGTFVDEMTDEQLRLSLLEARNQVRVIQDELARRKANRRQQAIEAKWGQESQFVANRKQRDLGIIEAMLDGESPRSIGLRLRLHPTTIASIYGEFERSLSWPSEPWRYRDYPAELVAKWVRQNPDEAGRAKYWYEQAFKEAQTIEPEKVDGDEEELILEREPGDGS